MIVLAGGDSPSGEVSLRSGAAVAAALVDAGHCVTRIDPAEIALDAVEWSGCDACFIALHGGAGRMAAFSSVGPVWRAVHRQWAGGLPPGDEQIGRQATAGHAWRSHARVVRHRRGRPDPRKPGGQRGQAGRTLGYPLIVKPDAQGSSLGITLVSLPKELNAAILAAERFDKQCLIEPYVVGREFTVALLDEQVLPPIEIISPERVFSYQAKYREPGHRVSFRVRTRRAGARRDVGGRSRRRPSAGRRGPVRVDLIVDNDDRVWVLELNTVPGMTARSLAPLAAARAGLDMTALCDLLVRQCLSHSGVA